MTKKENANNNEKKDLNLPTQEGAVVKNVLNLRLNKQSSCSIFNNKEFYEKLYPIDDSIIQNYTAGVSAILKLNAEDKKLIEFKNALDKILVVEKFNYKSNKDIGARQNDQLNIILTDDSRFFKKTKNLTERNVVIFKNFSLCLSLYFETKISKKLNEWHKSYNEFLISNKICHWIILKSILSIQEPFPFQFEELLKSDPFFLSIINKINEECSSQEHTDVIVLEFFEFTASPIFDFFDQNLKNGVNVFTQIRLSINPDDALVDWELARGKNSVFFEYIGNSNNVSLPSFKSYPRYEEIKKEINEEFSENKNMIDQTLKEWLNQNF